MTDTETIATDQIRTYSTDSPQDAFEDLVLERNAQRRKTRYQFLTEGQTVKFRDMTKSVKDVRGQLEKTTVTVRFL